MPAKTPKPRKFAQQDSWTIADWPAHVYPNSCSRAAYVVRANRDSLIAAGALARVGRELIVLGNRYQRWLELHTANVASFTIAPNRQRKEAAEVSP
jgi:hypothetical protein